MAIIETPDSHRYPWYVRLFFWNQKRRYGAVLEPARLWGRTPKVFATLALFIRRAGPAFIADRSGAAHLSYRARFADQLVPLLCRCQCLDCAEARHHRRKAAGNRGVPRSTLFSAREKAALDYAETMTRTGQDVTQEQFAALGEHFDDDALIELTALIAFQNLSSKFNAALQVPA